VNGDGHFLVLFTRLVAVIVGKATFWQRYMDGFVEVEQACFLETVIISVHVFS
jgi:hypothetical protein